MHSTPDLGYLPQEKPDRYTMKWDWQCQPYAPESFSILFLQRTTSTHLISLEPFYASTIEQALLGAQSWSQSVPGAVPR